MTAVVFLDTSILLNLLDVPGKNSDRDTVVSEFVLRQGEGDTFVIPATAVIEVGNHIAQLADGTERRHRAERFAKFLQHSLDGVSPWVVSGLVWDHDFLGRLINGNEAAYLPSLIDLATQEVGTGDAAILHEVQRYRERADVPSGQPVTIWSLDVGLSVYA